MEQKIITTIKTQDVIVFDGTCVLCNRFMRFVMRFDRQEHFKFLTAQSVSGQQLYKHHGLNPTDFDTFLVFINGRLYQRLDGVLAIYIRIGWPWKIAGLMQFLPHVVKDWLYARVARNRYNIFGQYDQCMVPSADIKARFIEEG